MEGGAWIFEEFEGDAALRYIGGLEAPAHAASEAASEPPP
jgi:hypothetical protein